MEVRSKLLTVWMGTILVSCVLVRAGEQVQFKGSTSVELPKPKRPLDEGRRMRAEPERPQLDGGFVTPPAESSPLTTRKSREEMDKKKNWIFANPYEQQLDSKTENFMSGEKGTGLYGNRWMNSETEEKSAVQKFMEERDSRPKKEGSRNEKENSEDRSERTRDHERDRERDREALDLDQEERDGKKSKDYLNPDAKADLGKGVLQTGIATDPFSEGPFEKESERGAFSENVFGSRKSGASVMDKEELKQQQVTHEREFDKILQTRLSSGNNPLVPVVGRIEGLNVGGGIGSLDLKTDSSRPGSLNMGRVGSSVPTSVSFTDGGPSLGGRPSFDRSFEGSFGSPVKAAPSFAPAAASQLPSSRPTVAPAPFSLPFPQRKF